ncbi:MAG TPA: YicC family protein [Firmicutes bacterium]|nr:YicC family protein [Bacillota bacterium]
MAASMTGYGKGEAEENGRKFSVEMKSVNHRFLDVSIKVPKFLNPLEDRIRKTIGAVVFRGKIDVFITFETTAKEDIQVRLNEELAAAYVQKLRMLEEKFGLISHDSLDLVAKFPDVITTEKTQEDAQAYWPLLERALQQAITSFLAMRQKEGDALWRDIEKKAEKIGAWTDQIAARGPLVVEEYRRKLTDRLKELFDHAPVDEQRIAQEIAIFADKACVDEETTRLKSHLLQLQDIFASEGSIGRRLDFLVQEMNREANTIASKSSDLEMTNTAILLKTEIEKIREQIQNIE